jgi:hypothetical protein
MPSKPGEESLSVRIKLRIDVFVGKQEVGVYCVVLRDCNNCNARGGNPGWLMDRNLCPNLAHIRYARLSGLSPSGGKILVQIAP